LLRTGRANAPRDLMYWKFRAYGFLKNLQFFDPFLVLFFREMGFSFLEIGVLYSIRGISINVLEVPTGVLADAYGRRRAMLAAFSAYIASFVVFYAAPKFWAYALAMVLFAIGETFRSGTHKAMILEHLRLRGMLDRKVDYYGHTRAASQLGSAIGALIAAGLVFYAGSYRIVFLASVVPYALDWLLLASYPRELDGDLVAIPGGWLQRAVGRLWTGVQDLVGLLRRPNVLSVLLNGAGFDAAYETTKDYLQPILRAQALALPVLAGLHADQRTALLVGVLYALIYLLTSYASSRAGRVEARVRRIGAAVDGTFLVGIGLLAAAGGAAWAGVSSAAIAAFLGVYVLHNLRRPIVVGFIADQIPHRAMATGLSVEVQQRTFLIAGLAPLLGFVADRLGVGAGILAIAASGIAVYPFLRVRRAGMRSAA